MNIQESTQKKKKKLFPPSWQLLKYTGVYLVLLPFILVMVVLNSEAQRFSVAEVGGEKEGQDFC